MTIIIDIETVDELERHFDRIVRQSPREAAEVAYVLAAHYHGKNNVKAKVFAQKSIELFAKCNMETHEQCIAIHRNICDIPVPELVHDGVVKARFADLLAA